MGTKVVCKACTRQRDVECEKASVRRTLPAARGPQCARLPPESPTRCVPHPGRHPASASVQRSRGFRDNSVAVAAFGSIQSGAFLHMSQASPCLPLVGLSVPSLTCQVQTKPLALCCQPPSRDGPLGFTVLGNTGGVLSRGVGRAPQFVPHLCREQLGLPLGCVSYFHTSDTSGRQALLRF